MELYLNIFIFILEILDYGLLGVIVIVGLGIMRLHLIVMGGMLWLFCDIVLIEYPWFIINYKVCLY